VIRVLLGAVLVLVAGQAVAAQSAQAVNGESVVEVRNLHLRGLDSLNGTAQDIDMRAGETIRFGYLEIKAERCQVPRDDPAGDAEAFLRIRDIREQTPRFSGWMFASSPALSAMDHPRYDVWVVSCGND
jgi:hypothetical protein